MPHLHMLSDASSHYTYVFCNWWVSANWHWAPESKSVSVKMVNKSATIFCLQPQYDIWHLHAKYKCGMNREYQGGVLIEIFENGVSIFMAYECQKEKNIWKGTVIFNLIWFYGWVGPFLWVLVLVMRKGRIMFITIVNKL